jgi:hypothetical protein
MCDGLIPGPSGAGVIKKKMKKNLLYLIILLYNCVTGYSQEIMNPPGMETYGTIHQIRTHGMGDILNYQTLNQGASNFAFTQQIGNQNTATVNQQADPAAGFPNQTYSIQDGNSNEMTLGQIGSGNLLLSFQLGYQTKKDDQNQGNHFGYGWENGNGNSSGHEHKANDYMVLGERNKLTIHQEGNDNGVLAVQQGNDNLIVAQQKGNNNYLAILQKGKNNTVSGYEQENTDGGILFETISQVGENLHLSSTNASGSKPNGNVFNQSGVNLSLEVNNGLINAVGGIEINQTGRDMTVRVDQSFFSFPKQ